MIRVINYTVPFNEVNQHLKGTNSIFPFTCLRAETVVQHSFV